jgi:PAS domain S-box-containing protein
LTVSPPIFSDDNSTLTPGAASALFDAVQPGSDRRGGHALLIINAKAQIAFSTPEALELFGARDRSDLQSRLLAGEGPTARRLRHLAVTLPIGEAPRLERMRFVLEGRSTGRNLRCARVEAADGPAFLVLWAPAASAPRDEPPPAGAAPDSSPSGAPVVVDAAKPPSKFRFLWSLDREGRFGAPDPALISALGANAPHPGETLDALRRRAGLERGEEIVRAVATRETFADVPVVWPLAGENRRLLMRLSAAPIFEQGRDFAGFRGFGRIVETITVSDQFEVAGAASPDALAFETSGDEPAERPSLVPGVDNNGQAERVLKAEAEGEAEKTLAEATADGSELVPALPESADEDEAAELAAGEAASKSGTPEDSPSGEAAGAPANAAPERTAEIYVLRQTHASASKVVPIRPGALDALAIEPGQGSGGESVELSKSERDAFREIARALVGRSPGARRDEGSEARPVAEASESPPPSPPAEAQEPGTDAEPTRETAVGNAWAILDRLPIGVLIVRDAKTLYLNHTLLDLLGYRNLEHFGASGGLATMFHGRDVQTMSMTDRGGLQIVSADGRPIAVDGLAQAVNWDGAPATLIAFRRLRGEDLERRPAGEKTRSRNGSASDLQDMLDLAADGAATLDSAGRIQSLSRPAEKLFGYDEKDVFGESVLMLLAPQSHPETTARLESLSREGDLPTPAGPIQVVGRDRAGAALSLALTLARIGPPDAPHYCALIKDTSGEREAERKLAASRDAALVASAAKTDFLAQVSHEIRTPLHAILGFAEVMMEERFGPIGNERYRDYLKDIHASGKHVMSLADDLLDLSKIEAGKLELAFAPVDANSLIRECISMMQPQAARERIIMRVSLFERLPQVMVDERSLKQIMLNLMSNAVKFNEPGGQVIVSTAVDNAGQAVIRVRDTGVGMSESEVGLALEPFSQVGHARRKGGAGLGLPLTKALVEANGAEFSIKSRRDQGTLIEIAFPTVRAA